MKKYLIKGLLALFGGTIIVGCADHDVDYVPLAQQKTQAYEAAFNEMMGGKSVDSKQNWGFDGLTVAEIQGMAQGRATTRDLGDGWWNISNDYDATFERNIIDEIIFDKLPEGISASNKLNNYEFLVTSDDPIKFSVVYAITSAHDKVGYYYYDPAAGINTRTERPFVDDIQNQYYFQYGFKDGHNWGTPVVNPNPSGNHDDFFNTQDDKGNFYCGQCQNIKHYYQWTCDHVRDHWNIDQVRAKTYYIRVPKGCRMGFYIINGDLNNGGHMMYSNKALNTEDGKFYSAVATLSNGSYAVGLEDWFNGDFDCNDIVMTIDKETLPEIINYSSSSKQQWKYKLLVSQGRVFCEDLGAAGRKDLDFNDIVFDARIWATQTFDVTTTNGGEPNYSNFSDFSYEADICMLAAGGTIPAKLIFNKTNDTRDVHPMFDPSIGMTTMVNTKDENAGDLVTGVTWENCGSKTYSGIDITNIINEVIAAHDSQYEITPNDIPISVLWQTSTDETTAKLGTSMGTVGELHAEAGKVPHKFCLPIGTKWPSERRPFDEAYPGFTDWAADSTNNSKFYENFVTTALYLGKGCNDKLPTSDSYGELGKGAERWVPVGDAENTQTTETETVAWTHVGLSLNNWGANDNLLYGDLFSKMDGNAADNTYTIRIYGTRTDGWNTDNEGWGAQILTASTPWRNVTGEGGWGATRDNSKFESKGYIEYRNISANLVSALLHDKMSTDYGKYCAILQGKNFVATQISFVKTVTVKK